VSADGPGSAVSVDSKAGSASVISATKPSRPCWAWATTAIAWNLLRQGSRQDRSPPGLAPRVPQRGAAARHRRRQDRRHHGRARPRRAPRYRTSADRCVPATCVVSPSRAPPRRGRRTAGLPPRWTRAAVYRRPRPNASAPPAPRPGDAAPRQPDRPRQLAGTVRRSGHARQPGARRRHGARTRQAPAAPPPARRPDCLPVPGVAGHRVGHAREQRLVTLAQCVQGGEVRLRRPDQRAQHGLGARAKVSGGAGGTAAGPPGTAPGSAHAAGTRSPRREPGWSGWPRRARVPAGMTAGSGPCPVPGRQAGRTRLDHPQPAQARPTPRRPFRLLAVETVQQRQDQVVLLVPDQLDDRDVVTVSTESWCAAPNHGPRRELASHSGRSRRRPPGAPRRTRGPSPASGSGPRTRCPRP